MIFILKGNLDEIMKILCTMHERWVPVWQSGTERRYYHMTKLAIFSPLLIAEIWNFFWDRLLKYTLSPWPFAEIRYFSPWSFAEIQYSSSRSSAKICNFFPRSLAKIRYFFPRLFADIQNDSFSQAFDRIRDFIPWFFDDFLAYRLPKFSIFPRQTMKIVNSCDCLPKVTILFHDHPLKFTWLLFYNRLRKLDFFWDHFPKFVIINQNSRFFPWSFAKFRDFIPRCF